MTDQKSRNKKKAPAHDVSRIQNFLNTIGDMINPTVHVNGIAHPTAVITVDMGTPKTPTRLTGEQAQELSSLLKRATRDLYKEDVNIRISSDHHNGIFWSSVG